MIRLQQELVPLLRITYQSRLRDILKRTLSDYLVLDVSREHALEETLNQIWRQERRCLMKPLKVRLGMQEGEVGLDHGGITYEFFRVVLGQAFNQETGTFTD